MSRHHCRCVRWSLVCLLVALVPAAADWTRLPDLPLAASGRYAGGPDALLVAGGAHFPVSLFAGGGKQWTAAISVLLPGEQAWRDGGQLPRPLGYGCSITTPQGLVCLGGADATEHVRDVWRLRWDGRTVVREPLPDLPEPTAYAAAALVGDVIYLAGGQVATASTTARATLWALDLRRVERGWQTLEPLPAPGRILAVAAAAEGAFYLFGGCSLAPGPDGKAQRTYLTDAWRYRPGAGWDALEPLPRAATAAPSPAPVIAGEIRILSGDDGRLARRVQEVRELHPGFERGALIFNLQANRWRRGGTAPFGLVTTPAVAWHGAVVVPGGEDRPGHRSPEVWSSRFEEVAMTRFVAAGQPALVREEGAAWQRGDGWIEGAGVNNILWAGRQIGPGEVTVTIELTIFGLAKSAASVVLDGDHHFGFEGAGGTPFTSGTLFGGNTTPNQGQPLVQDGRPFKLELARTAQGLTVSIDGRQVHAAPPAGIGPRMIGLRPWRARMRVTRFEVTGETSELPPPRSMPTGFTIPTVDLSPDPGRQVVIAQGTAEVYQGHPTTVLLADGQTMIAVWTINHGGTCGPLKRSTDGGLTWGELIPTPENWPTIRNCPSIHRLTDPQGVERLFVFAGNGAMYQSVSTDQGLTWTPFAPNGLGCVVAPLTIVPLSGQRHLAIYHRGGERDTDSVPGIYQSITADGGLTWGPERLVIPRDHAFLCEPSLVVSPDGRRIACLMRENTRRYNSFIMFTADEGANWTQPVELPASLTGDRHMPRYAPDGRLVICFRDMAAVSPTKGDFVAWVGSFADLEQNREGQCRVKLLDSPKKVDLGYPGLELLPDGTLVATTYAVLRQGEKNSVVSVRFSMADVDRGLSALRQP